MARHGVRLTMALLAVCALVAGVPADGAVKTRTVVILPFDASALDRDDQWIGEGAAQVIGLGLCNALRWLRDGATVGLTTSVSQALSFCLSSVPLVVVF